MAEFGIASKIVTPQVDFLGTANKAQNLQKGMLQNRLLGQQIGGKEALGRAITGATDAEGNTDWNKGLGALAADPQGAFAVPELAASVQQRDLMAQQIAAARIKVGNDQIDQFGKKLEMGANMAIGLLSNADKTPITADLFKTEAQRLIETGLFNDPASQKELVAVFQHMGPDTAQNAEALKQFVMRAKPTLEAIQMTKGTPQNVDTGGQIVNQQVSPLTGEVDINGQIEKTRGPDAKAALVPVYDPATQTTHMVPSGQVVGDANPNAPRPMDVQQGPGLGEPEAAAGAAQQFVQLRQQAEKTPEVKAALSNIRDTVGGFKPGTKANWAYGVNALATQLGVASPKMKNEAAAQEEFNKLATQFINQQVGALGGTGTDAKLESARHGSPNEFMTKQGIQNVTSLMMGLNDAVAAKNAAAEKWMASGNGPGTYGKFVTQFNKLYDPRVFQSVYMTPEQKQTMLGGMTKDERAEFQQHWTAAKKFGWIK